MRMAITHAMARGLWSHLHERYYTMLVSRLDGEAMQGVRLVLDAMGLRGHSQFLRQNTLTMIDTIYVPFLPGELSNTWPPASQVAVAIHEHHHVVQAECNGAMMFVGSYLMRRSARASYEAEAFRTNLEFHYWLTGELPDVNPLAEMVAAYGCSQEQVNSVRTYLELCAPAIESGEVLSETVRVATAWLEENRHPPNG